MMLSSGVKRTLDASRMLKSDFFDITSYMNNKNIDIKKLKIQINTQEYETASTLADNVLI